MDGQSLRGETKEEHTHRSVDPVIGPEMVETNEIQPIAIILNIEELL